MEPRGVPRQAESSLDLSGFQLGFITDWLSGIVAFWPYLLGGIILATSFYLLWRWVRSKRDEIQKIWVFILFFLTKRQMMIPLVITLSEKDGLLDKDLRNRLMEIRQKSREVSFKRYPDERLAVEEQVSKILFHYFTTLEKKDQIQPGTKFAKLVKDLEFIDAKLVQLQKVYNQDVHRWNRWVDFPVISLLARLVGAAPFRAFK